MRNGFRNIGSYTLTKLDSIHSFLSFVGYFIIVVFKLLRRHKALSFTAMLKILYLSGFRLCLPIMIISAMIGFSIAVTLYHLLGQFYLENKAFPITLELIIGGIAPIFMGVILAVQSSLNLINIQAQKLRHESEELFHDFILPVTLGIFVTGFLFYTYALFSFLSSSYITFQYALNANTLENWEQFGNTISFGVALNSYYRMMVYCVIVGLVVGYYYYRIHLNKISVRKGVSRIMTRSVLFIIIDSTGLNLLSF